MAKKVKGAAYGSVGLSVLAVVLLTLGFPMLMGGSVQIAVMFSEEVKGKESPTDDNGFQWLEAGSCTSHGSMSNTVTQFDGKNWTHRGNSLSSTSSFNCWSSARTDDVFTLRIPDQLFNTTDSLSKFTFEMVSSSQCSNCKQAWSWDYNMTINGSQILTGDASNNQMYEVGNNDYWNYSFSHRIDGIELMNIRDEMAKCESSCDVQLNFFNVKKGSISGYDYSGQPFQNSKVRIETFTTDADLEGLIMTLSPWLITVLTFLIAIGSTRYWQPLKGWYA